MNDRIPGFVIGGTGSGCGKTTVTCAVEQALTDRGLRLASFKCGPDYIDTMFHTAVTGTPCTNLDSFFFSPETLRGLLAKHACGRDLAVVEGVMGYYDGRGLTTAEGSTWEIASLTGLPAVLTVNARGAALSVLAVLAGFASFREDSRIRGVIFNGCTAMTYAALSEEIRRRFGGSIRPLGYLPAMPECALESRHLGLVTAAEVGDLTRKRRLLAEQAERTVDLDGLLALAAEDAPPAAEPVRFSAFPGSVRIAVARDRAFCFCYDDNLRALEEMGAELAFFSPLADACLPDGIHGLYLVGGYPELYARQLSANTGMRESVRRALSAGLPCIAECGGFLYLCEELDGLPMVGLLPGGSRNTGKLVRFGYVVLTAEKDNMLCGRGETIRAHEFHHYDSDDPGADFTARKISGKSWPCVHASATLYAGYPHFHFYAEPSFAMNFYRACVREGLRVAESEGKNHA